MTDKQTTDTQSILDRAEERCCARGSRLTKKRQQILKGLIESGKALSAYELIDYYKAEYGENIPAMSVYRILDFLCSENLTHKLNLANKYVACSHIACNHSHEVPQFLICGQCSQVSEIAIKRSLIDTLKINVEDAHYQLSSNQIELDCLCQSCAT